MKLLADLLPDMTGKALFRSSCLARDVRQRFGMSPLLISAMACMWGQVPQALRKKALAASYVAIIRAVEKVGNAHAQPLDWAHFLV